MMVFADYGIPVMIVTNSSPQFKLKDFEQLCEKFMINHETSSPHHPQSNGNAKNAVKQMKHLIHCTFDPHQGTVNLEKCMKALLLFQNTPCLQNFYGTMPIISKIFKILSILA
jgi:transposase InsO family protein